MHYQSSLFKSKTEWEKPTVADKVVEWAGVVGKHISWEFKNTIAEGEKHWRKTAGKIRDDMHGKAQVYQRLMCNTLAHHACSASIPADWHFISAKEIHGKQNQEQNMAQKQC